LAAESGRSVVTVWREHLPNDVEVKWMEAMAPPGELFKCGANGSRENGQQDITALLSLNPSSENHYAAWARRLINAGTGAAGMTVSGAVVGKSLRNDRISTWRRMLAIATVASCMAK
jgi:hypothetical protein